MVDTNIKGLPEGKFFTEIGYSQQYPWVMVKRTDKTVTLAKVIVKADPEWKPNILPGGFAGHCDNQYDQTWIFDRIDPTWKKVIRMTKRGWAADGVRFVEDRAREFYDYNF